MTEVTLDQVYAVQLATKEQVDKVEAHLEKLNGRVSGQDVRVAVLEEWKRCVGEPSAKETTNLKVELAKIMALGGGAGGVFWLLELVGKFALGK